MLFADKNAENQWFCGSSVGAVVLGGLGTMLVVLLVALIWPEVRRLGQLN